MAGMYGSFQQAMVGESNQRNKYTYWGEGRSDNFERGGNSGNDFGEMQINGLTAGNTWADWTSLYRVINLANMNIKYIPGIAETEPNKALVTQEIIDRNLAESYGMRAICYFYVVRVWGDAVVRTEPYEDLAESPERPRESREKVIDELIIPDLLKAYELIKKSATPNVFYINEGAICATLVDVYMWKASLTKNQEDYKNAMKWFGNLAKAKAPTGKVYTAASMTDLQPTATWNNMFTDPSKSNEAIWNIHWDFFKNGCACMTAVSVTSNNTSLIIDTEIFNSWPATNPTDIRVKATFDVTKTQRDRVWKYYVGSYTTPGVNGATGTYSVPDANRTQQSNVFPVMYRLGDQFLLYAEALNKTGDQLNAIKYLNFIRKRAGLTEYTSADDAVNTPEKLEKAIIQERRWELFGEGKRWFDLVRTGLVIEVMDPIVKRRQVTTGVDLENVTGWGTDVRKYYWPLHRNVLNSNSLLVQNQPYSD